MHSKLFVFSSFYLTAYLSRVQTDQQEGRGDLFGGAEGAVDQDGEVRGDQVHEGPLLQH
jgi:hypothetical protein